jgi:RNA polymerase II subunit A C-terminal domain phosphatase SSU72
LESREKENNQPVHVINIDVLDNHEDATLGAFILYELAEIVNFLFNKIILIYLIVNK